MTSFAGDPVIGRSLEVYGEWAQNEINLLSMFLPAGAVALDAGANIGTHTLAFAACVGNSGRVLAFEPQPDVFRLLCQNLRDNSVECVDARCVALSDRQETLYAPLIPSAGEANIGAAELFRHPPPDQQMVSVHAAMIDELRLERCDLIKADVEGMEIRVLEGAKSTLLRCLPILYLECNTLPHAVCLFEYLRDKPYRLYVCKTLAFNRTNFFGSRIKVFGSASESSLLAIPIRGDLEFRPDIGSEIRIVPIASADDLAAALAETQLIAELQQGLANAERLCKERSEETHRYEAALAEAQALVGDRDRQLRIYDGALAGAQAFVSQRDQQLRIYDGALAEAQRLVSESQQEARRHEAALSIAHDLVLQRDDEITQLRAADEKLGREYVERLERVEIALAGAHALASQRQMELRRCGEVLTDAQDSVVQRERAIAQLHLDLADALNLTAELKKEMDSAREEASRLNRDCSGLFMRLEEIERSLPWRLVKRFFGFRQRSEFPK